MFFIYAEKHFGFLRLVPKNMSNSDQIYARPVFIFAKVLAGF